MLTAFTPQSLIELKQRDKSKIDSVLAYGDKLLVGLNTGALRIYRINDQAASQSSDLQPLKPHVHDEHEQLTSTTTRIVDLLREEEKFSKRPVQQLAMVKEAGVLVSLSDGYISLHDLNSFELQQRLDQTKGATSFAVTSDIVKDETTGIPAIVSRLAVAVKRRVMLWSWFDMELHPDPEIVTLVSAAKNLTWATSMSLIAGLDSGFIFINIESFDIRDIIKPGQLEEAGSKFGAVSSAGMGYMGMGSWVPKPLATKLSQGQLLLAKDVNTLFIDSNGTALEKRQVPWPTAPEAIGYSYPYLLALQSQPKYSLEIRNPESSHLLQSIPLANATFLHVPQPNISLAHAGKGFLVASDRCIWRMNAADYNSQITSLIDTGQFDEAISLINMLEDTLLENKQDRLRSIRLTKAQSLFGQRKYREALDLFSEAMAPPCLVISLYPKTIAGAISTVSDHAMPAPESVEQEDESPGEAINTGGPSSPKDRDTPRRSMLGRLMGETRKPESETSSIKSSRATEGSDRPGRATGEEFEADKALEGKDLLRAVDELCAFLAQTRVKMQKLIWPNGKLKESLTTSVSTPETFKPSFYWLLAPVTDEEEVDWHSRLLEVATLVDTTLFRAYMLVRPGLAGSLFRLDNFCDALVVRDKLYDTGRYADLIDFLHGKRLHREALEMLEKFGKDVDNAGINPALKGPQRTVAYLQQLPPEQIDLILEFSRWPLEEDVGTGMQVFLADSENAETLPRERVVKMLQGISPDLAIQYLEHIVEELHDINPEMHQLLIDLLLGKLKRQGIGDDEQHIYKEKLERLLQESEQFNKARVFSKLWTDDANLYESRAIVLQKLGQHKQALQIYVFQMKDYEKAERYCNQIYMATADETSLTGEPERSIYHTLLSLYLNPPAGSEARLEAALDLLSIHGARLPASQTLGLIPGEVSIATLESYFTGRIRSANSRLNEDRIAAQLRGVQKASLEENGAVEKNRRVVVSEERLCPVCMKRFGGSAVRVHADGRVVHYGCSGIRGASTAGEWARKSNWGRV